jgi:uncharacterized Zn-finger protein
VLKLVNISIISIISIISRNKFEIKFKLPLFERTKFIKIHSFQIDINVYLKASILAYHRKSHTGERRTIKHSISRTNRSDNYCEPFICDLVGCGKTFDNITNLRRHQAIHNGTRLYYCDWQVFH